MPIFGEPIRLNVIEQVTSEQDPTVSDGWEVSEQAHRQIEEIEESIRSSEQRSGTFLFR